MPGRGQEYHFNTLVAMNKEIARKKKQGYEPIHVFATKKGVNTNMIGPSPTGSGYTTDPGTLFIVEFRRVKEHGSRQRFHL